MGCVVRFSEGSNHLGKSLQRCILSFLEERDRGCLHISFAFQTTHQGQVLLRGPSHPYPWINIQVIPECTLSLCILEGGREKWRRVLGGPSDLRSKTLNVPGQQAQALTDIFSLSHSRVPMAGTSGHIASSLRTSLCPTQGKTVLLQGVFTHHVALPAFAFSTVTFSKPY